MWQRLQAGVANVLAPGKADFLQWRGPVQVETCCCNGVPMNARMRTRAFKHDELLRVMKLHNTTTEAACPLCRSANHGTATVEGSCLQARPSSGRRSVVCERHATNGARRAVCMAGRAASHRLGAVFCLFRLPGAPVVCQRHRRSISELEASIQRDGSAAQSTEALTSGALPATDMPGVWWRQRQRCRFALLLQQQAAALKQQVAGT